MGQIKNIKLHIVTDIKYYRQVNRIRRSKMILYKDLFTTFDVFTDVFKMELVDDLYYKIYGKYIVEDSTVDESVFGGNKSAEAEEEEGEEDNKVLIPDIVASSKLSSTVESSTI